MPRRGQKKTSTILLKTRPLLEKYRSMLVAEQTKNADLRIRRPAYTSGVFTLKPAMQWRQDCIKEMTRLLSRINAAGISEFEVREINDQLNKILRDKHAWELRIKELGGKVVNQVGLLSDEGVEIPGVRGYRYFGKAKELPGVKGLLAGEGEVTVTDELKKTREETRRHINATYFGYNDEENSELLSQEAALEQDLLMSARSYAPVNEQEVAEASSLIPDHFLVPSQRQIEQYLISQKQQEILRNFS